MESRAESAQLSLFCACGRRPMELKGPGCCRVCYYRRYRSLRFFGGLREAVLRRDRFRCRVCGAKARLVVHHRNGDNRKRRLITLCIGCHTRVHRYWVLRRWVPEVLLKLWSERHPKQPLQLQLPFGVEHRANRRLPFQWNRQCRTDPPGRDCSAQVLATASTWERTDQR